MDAEAPSIVCHTLNLIRHNIAGQVEIITFQTISKLVQVTQTLSA